MGTLYVVATPIGNLEDITLRALRVLKEVDLIACEDTRQTQKLLNRYNIKKRLVSYFEYNKLKRGEELLRAVEDGQNVALVSDAGTPTVSDPGFNLVRDATIRGISVVPIPGPSAVVAALSAAGLPTDQFHFVGFLPQREGKRRRLLESLQDEPATLVLYESPFRVRKTLELAREVLGDRRAVLAHELTKIHEGFFRGRLSELWDKIEEIPARGEWVLVLAASTS